ncbi:hypothetical protein A5791_03730 [Mycobacterium sp. 852002-51163_SCH5372311]|nr:hypothetical protein A5791_03730 [Mycobacterium sp. 852002-51163_SCH5372311]
MAVVSSFAPLAVPPVLPSAETASAPQSPAAYAVGAAVTVSAATAAAPAAKIAARVTQLVSFMVVPYLC